MSNEYITLVLARPAGVDDPHSIRLFKAPRGTYFEDGQGIIVETRIGNCAAVVVKSETYETIDSKLAQMLIAATGASLPLPRVIAKEVPIEWHEDEEEKENSDGE